MRLAALALAAVILLGACSAPRRTPDAGPAPDADGLIQFSVIGDMPYCDEEDAMLTLPDGAIAKSIRAADPPVLIHFGDLKSGGDACTDSLLVARREQIFNLNPFRAVFTPGDNGWTDCDRENMHPRYDELERLAFLRSIFYQGEGLKLTRDIPDLTRQTGFSENARWTVGALVFGTLHVPGTNNGRREILLSDTTQALDEADRRDAHNVAWVDTLFDAAGAAPALVITFQADIYRPDRSASYHVCTRQRREDCDGYKRIRDHIEYKAAQYEKPVLIIHGDTNAYCFHKPAEGLAPNLWRLNALGDFKVSDAATVTFDPRNPAAPFSVRSMVGQSALPAVCDYSRSSQTC